MFRFSDGHQRGGPLDSGIGRFSDGVSDYRPIWRIMRMSFSRRSGRSLIRRARRVAMRGLRFRRRMRGGRLCIIRAAGITVERTGALPV